MYWREEDNVGNVSIYQGIADVLIGKVINDENISRIIVQTSVEAPVGIFDQKTSANPVDKQQLIDWQIKNKHRNT